MNSKGVLTKSYGPDSVSLLVLSRSDALPVLREDAALLKSLHDDCASVFTEESFWLAANQRGRCSLEELALAIFRAHTAQASFDPQTSGVEWWVQLRMGGDRAEDIGFHTDKDEDLVVRRF